MKNIIVDDIIRECNGKLIIGNKQEKCENFVIDSRIIKEGDIYVVINSEKRNGNIFCEEALKKGAKGCIVNINDFEVKKLREYEKNGKFIVQVKDTIEAVQKLSSYKRNLYDIPVIGIKAVSNNEFLKEEYYKEVGIESQKFTEKLIKNIDF